MSLPIFVIQVTLLLRMNIYRVIKGGSFSIQPSNGLKIDPVTGKVIPAGANTGTYNHLHHKCFRRMLFVCNINKLIGQQKPTASIQYPPICSSDGDIIADISGTKGGTFSAVLGFSIDRLTGTIIPSSSTPGTYTVKYTVAPSLRLVLGFDTSVHVTITKAPSASINYPADLCNFNDISNPPVAVTLLGEGEIFLYSHQPGFRYIPQQEE